MTPISISKQEESDQKLVQWLPPNVLFHDILGLGVSRRLHASELQLQRLGGVLCRGDGYGGSAAAAFICVGHRPWSSSSGTDWFSILFGAKQRSNWKVFDFLARSKDPTGRFSIFWREAKAKTNSPPSKAHPAKTRS